MKVVLNEPRAESSLIPANLHEFTGVAGSLYGVATS